MVIFFQNFVEDKVFKFHDHRKLCTSLMQKFAKTYETLNSGPGNQNQAGRGDHRNDRGGGGGGGGGMNRNNSSPLRGSDSMKNRGGMPSSSRDHGSRRDERNNTRDRSGGNDRESHNIRDRSRDKERSLSSRSSPPPPPTRKRSRSPRRTRLKSALFINHEPLIFINTYLSKPRFTQCADEKSNENVEDMDDTFAKR